MPHAFEGADKLERAFKSGSVDGRGGVDTERRVFSPVLQPVMADRY
jgi:hypothetical protein